MGHLWLPLEKPIASSIQLLKQGHFTFSQGYNLPEVQLSTVLGSAELKQYWGYGRFCENTKNMMSRENNAPMHIFLNWDLDYSGYDHGGCLKSFKCLLNYIFIAMRFFNLKSGLRWCWWTLAERNDFPEELLMWIWIQIVVVADSSYESHTHEALW